MQDARSALLQLLVRLSYKEGDFTLSSGAKSDYYIDCRATTLSAEGAHLTGRVVLDTIRQHGWQPDAIGGMTLGADPIVISVSLLSAQEANAHRPIDGFLVRKAEKAHGMQRRVEGFSRPGAKVIVVDDVCTTGGSTIQAIEAVRAAGMEVVGVVVLVEREASGMANIEAVASPARVASVFTVPDLRAQYRAL
jgi:orotate phosphoribosyltransferase